MDDQVVLVCQKCDDKPTLNTGDFADHLVIQHKLEISDKDHIDAFIKDNVTFEEQLVSDLESNIERDSDTTEEDSSKDNTNLETAKEIPALFCPYCDSAFSSTTRLIHHLKKHIQISIEDGVECCKFVYKSKKDYVSHLQENHIKRCLYDPKTMCKSCKFIADSETQLKSHVEICHKEKNIIPKKILKTSDKNQHWIPAVCPVCNQTYSNKYNMFAHLKSHNKTNAFKCEQCDREYSTKGNLMQHVRLAHEGDLPHACVSCGERFATRTARDIHARLHTGDRPFRCEICYVSFRAKNTLLRHLDMHLNIRKHECEICKKTFRKRSHLLVHGRTHRKR